MTFAEAAMIMMSGEGCGVIKPLTITENGKYSAADYGCDGFDPVNVNVPDRYDEGYKDGSDFYKKLYEKEKGNGETVTDIAGNTIENAIVVTSLDDVNAYLRATEFTPGDSITITNLGADTSIRYQVETYPYTAAGDTGYRLNIFIKNLNTGKERKYSTPNIFYAPPGAIGTIKLTYMQPMYNYTEVTTGLSFYVNGSLNYNYSMSAYARDVNGTAFAAPDAGYAYS